MPKGYCLDSDVLIWQLRNARQRTQVTAQLASLAQAAPLACSVLSIAEISQGMRSGEEAKTNALLDALVSHPIDRAVAERAGSIVRDLKAKGRTMHLADALIAATCLVHELTLVTLNVKDFAHVAGLLLEEVA
jgi:tRNA(fMet)-specific endonuclease VapC